MEPQDHASRIRRLDPDQLSRLRQALRGRKQRGNQLVAESLASIGVKRVYSVSGSPIDSLLKAVNENKIHVFGVRSQFGATIISGVDNFITGNLVSAVCVSSGPAVSNCLTGIHVAEGNQRPLLVLGSRRGFPGEGGAFQHATFVDLMAPLTKLSADISTAEDIYSMLHKARQVAMEGQPGPVYLEFPEHILEGVGLSGAELPQPDNQEADPVEIPVSVEEPVRLLLESKRPLLCLSEDLRWGLDREGLRSLVERHQLPFITTPMGRGMIPDSHPLCFNSWRRRALREMDLFVLLGGALDWRFRHGNDIPTGCQVIQANGKADQLGMNFPTAWQAQLAPPEFARALGEALADPMDAMSGWHDQLAEHGAPRGRPFAGAYENPAGYADPVRFLRGLSELIPEEAIFVIDGSICLSLANHSQSASSPFSWFDPGINGCIGMGIPQAIGAKLAAPDRPVVAIVGDTGFGMSGFELETAARYGIAIKVVVFNNSGVNGAHRDRKIFGGESERRISRYQDGLRYDKVAEGLGVESAHSNDADEALEMVSAMLATSMPGCLNLAIDPAYPVPDIW